MAGQQSARVIQEDDEILPPNGTQQPQPNGHDTAPAGENQPAAGGDVYEMVEDVPGTAEAPLTEGAAGPQPLIPSQEPSAQQPRQRLSHKERRANGRAARDRDQSEIRRLTQQVNDLAEENSNFRQRLDGVEPRVVELGDLRLREKLQQVDRDLTAADADFNQARKDISSALKDQDFDRLDEAMGRRDDAALRKVQLTGQKNQLANLRPREPGMQNLEGVDDGGRQPREQRQPPQDQRQQQQPRQPQYGAAARRYAEDFSAGLDWFDANPGTRDQDSRVLQMLDASVLADGFRPDTQDYWDELEDRGSVYLPHRFPTAAAPDEQPLTNQRPNQRQPTSAAAPRAAQPERRGPMVAGAAERPAPLGKNQVRINPDRKNALIAAGVLNDDGTVNDRKKFQGMLKQYAEYDRLHGQTVN